MIRKLVLATAFALSIAGVAHADINVSIWTGVSTSVSQNATIAQAGTLGAATATTTVSAINFNSAVGGYTVGGFLNNPVLPGAVASSTLNNTYMLFTGQVALNAGSNSFSVAHDDGLQLTIAGIPGFVVDAPGPSSPSSLPFNVTAPSAGLYNFTMSYGECCGSPAELIWNINDAVVTGTGVPEPATWTMMIIGIAGVGVALRRRRALAKIAA